LNCTPAAYRAFQEAYDFFNAELFGGFLPHVLVMLQRHAKARGYFSPERLPAAQRTPPPTRLAMNPDSFNGPSDELLLSTLAHEMAHVWQQSHGTPLRRSYHDRQWAAKMKEIGVQPTAIGEPRGKEIGQHVTYYIIPGGFYAEAFAKLKAKGFQIHRQSAPEGTQAKRRKVVRRNSRARSAARTHGPSLMRC
jgi:hypothetical protein